MDAPRKILLATDLSARSDRAFDRALLLSRTMGAELVVLHVLEVHEVDRLLHHAHPDDLEAIARRHLHHDLGAAADQVRIRIERGDPAELIIKVSREEACSLIVTGVARNERIGRFTLGAVVDRLVRGSLIPLLIVTERARMSYRHIAVALDFSTVSAQALTFAAALFPDQRLTAFHGYHAPADYAAGDPTSHRQKFRLVAHATYEAFLTTAGIPAATRARLIPHLEWGNPEQLLHDLAERDHIDLVVLGTRGHGRIFEFFVGSVAKRILTELPCDALVVREHAG